MTVSWALTSCGVIAVVLVLRAALGRWISARLRYALWLLALVRLLIPAQLITVPAAALPEIGRERSAAPYQQETASDTVGEEWESGPILPLPTQTTGEVEREEGSGAEPQIATSQTDLSQLPRWIWAAGVCVTLAAFLLSDLSFTRRLRRVRWPVDDAGSRLPVYGAIGLPSPCLFGLFRPAIYLTPEAAGDEAVRRHVLVHEETHFRHGDHIWSLLRCLALALHWWNPLVWLGAVLSRRDGELACDEGALRRLGDGQRAAYGETLLQLVTVKAGPRDLLSSATTMTGGKRELRERIRLISRKRKVLVSLSAAAVLLLSLLTVVAFLGPEDESWRTAEIMVDESGIPYRRDAGEWEWTQLGGPIAPPAEWAEQDLAGRDQAQALEVSDNAETYAGYVSASDAWLTVTYGRGVAAADTYVYRSEDGGETWREVTRPPTSWHLSAVGFLDEDTLIVASRLFDGAPVYITRDGGETWEEIPLPEGAYQAESVSYDGETVSIYVSASAAFADGDPGWVLRSTDLGATWNTEKADAPAVTVLPEYQDDLGPVPQTVMADVTHDGAPDELTVYKETDQVWRLSVTDGATGEEIWSEEAGTPHAGWNALFLCALEGEDYILRYNPTMYQGVCDYSYQVFWLEDGGTVIRDQSSVHFTIDPPQETTQEMTFAPDAIAAFLDEVNAYLAQSQILLVTDEDLLNTFAGQGGYLMDTLWWLDSDVYVRNEEYTLVENLMAYWNAVLAQASIPTVAEVFSSITAEAIVSIEPRLDILPEALAEALNGAAETPPYGLDPDMFTPNHSVTVTYLSEGDPGEQTMILETGDTEDLVQVTLFGQSTHLFFSENPSQAASYLHDTPYSCTSLLMDKTLYRTVRGGSQAAEVYDRIAAGEITATVEAPDGRRWTYAIAPGTIRDPGDTLDGGYRWSEAEEGDWEAQGGDQVTLADQSGGLSLSARSGGDVVRLRTGEAVAYLRAEDKYDSSDVQESMIFRALRSPLERIIDQAVWDNAVVDGSVTDLETVARQMTEQIAKGYRDLPDFLVWKPNDVQIQEDPQRVFDAWYGEEPNFCFGMGIYISLTDPLSDQGSYWQPGAGLPEEPVFEDYYPWGMEVHAVLDQEADLWRIEGSGTGGYSVTLPFDIAAAPVSELVDAWFLSGGSTHDYLLLSYLCDRPLSDLVGLNDALDQRSGEEAEAFLLGLKLHMEEFPSYHDLTMADIASALDAPYAAILS